MGLFGTGKSKVCAVTAAATAREMAAQVQAALWETPTVELRLDWLRSDGERRRLLAWVKRQKFGTSVSLMATCRRVPPNAMRGFLLKEALSVCGAAYAAVQSAATKTSIGSG